MVGFSAGLTLLEAGDQVAAVPTVAMRQMGALRIAGAMEAQELVTKGDESYNAGRFREATEAYDGARELLPEFGEAASYRNAVVERWAQASVEHSRALAKQGEYEAARTVVARVLADGGLPAYQPARNLQAEINDPIRYNPALTPGHTEAVVEVSRQLRMAEGFFALGSFDQAKRAYEDVLKLDRHNSAARRGMERIAVEKSKYYAAAYDHTRAELLTQADAQWELQAPEAVAFADLAAPTVGVLGAEAFVGRKLDTILIPQVDLQEATLADSLDFLRSAVSARDSAESDAAKRGIDFVVNLREATPEAAALIAASRVNLKLTNLPARKVLDYIAEQTHTQVSVDEFAVRITPLGVSSARMITRTFRVAPDFISRQSTSVSGNGAGAAAVDVFAAQPKEGLLPRKLSAKEVLESLGVNFAAGASAQFSAASSSVVVTNTPDMISLVEQILANDAQTEPVQIVFKVTMIRARQNDLKELGYDWLMKELSNGALILGGKPPMDVTAGQRSGDFAIAPDSIDGALARDSFAQTVDKAPGIMALDTNHFATLLRGLDQKGGADVLSVPSVVTRPGQRARVEFVNEFIHPTEYEAPELPNSVGGGFDNNDNNNNNNNNNNGGGGGRQGTSPVTPSHPTAFAMRMVGTILELEAVVSPDRNYIDVQLAPTQTDFDGFVNYGSPIRGGFTGGVDGLFDGENDSSIITENKILMPVFRTMKANTSVSIADGGTLVFGGMQEERIQNVEDKTPILGDLPLVGRFFQTKARQSLKTAIIFVVHAELVDPSGRPYRQR
jgi:general secretion pathway protein D